MFRGDALADRPDDVVNEHAGAPSPEICALDHVRVARFRQLPAEAVLADVRQPVEPDVIAHIVHQPLMLSCSSVI